MAGNYEKGIYNQLMEVMARLDTVEKESKKKHLVKRRYLYSENRESIAS